MLELRMALVVALLAITSFADGEPVRTWTSKSGKTLEARYSKLTGDQVGLLDRDGNRRVIPLSQLSQQDQAVVRKLAKAAGHLTERGTGAINEAKGTKLASFADGPWRGINSIYQTSTFWLQLHENGHIHMQPIREGKPSGLPMRIHAQRVHIDTKAKGHARWNPKKIKELNDSPKPALLKGDATLTFSGTFDDESTFELTIEATRKDVTFQLTHDESRDRAPVVTNTRLVASVLKSIPESDTMELAQLKKTTDGWYMELSGPDLKRTKYPFWKSMRSILGITECTFYGPWEDRKVHISAAPIKGGGDTQYAKFEIYADRALYDGGHITASAETKRQTLAYTVTVQ